MRAGLQVFNELNTIQIDDRFSSYTLSEKVTLTSSRILGSSNSYDGILYTVVGLDTVVAVQCKTGSTLTRLQTMTSDSWRIGIATQGRGQTVTLFLFRPGIQMQSTEGLQVFNDDGELVFDANANNLSGERLIDLKVGQPGQTYPLTPGREYAVIYSQWGGRITTIWGPGGGGPAAWEGFIFRYGPVVVPSTGAISVSAVLRYAQISMFSNGARPPDGDAYYLGGPILVADVTGL